ncbi:hypothetical protein F7018_00980 [Tenacibaculum aiptasiae]|uniref:Uncharacterized protein n=1 Tax=Tenacibaculum aiptasiae TaxID=426481 RepID=A0A7J5ASZ8_9FLAO|nr:hypothetical protein [Tenacibaculum aiptasiae]KAB1160481.1 hypothetical protein F7018_00980 [Tenacibaculum aiptasiae]
MLTKILLKDTIEFNGTISDLKEKINLNNKPDFKIEWSKQNELKFLSNISFGTLTMSGFPGAIDGIKGYGSLSESENGNTLIEMNTKIRIELYFALFVSLFIFFVGYISGENFPIWIYLLLPFSLLWFWFIFRIQEKRLFKKFKNYINRIE